MIRISILLEALLVSGLVSAHHSSNAFYDRNTNSELVGTITSVDWVNPHVRFTLEVINDNNEHEVWALEASSINILDRHGFGRENLTVGNQVTVVGYLSRFGLKEMGAAYISVPGGEDVVLWAGLFGGREQGNTTIGVDATSAAPRPRGIFRVWTLGEYPHLKGAPDGSGNRRMLPYAPMAVAARERFDPLTDDTALRCIPQGMPGIMDNPFPMEIVEQGDDIVFRIEQWDVVRTIHMSGDQSSGSQLASPQGYSVGRWEQDTLVVTTTQVNWPFFDDIGTPQSEDIEIVERFSLSAEESRLNYTITAIDPVTFTESVSFETGYWVWVPGEEVKPYNCTL